MLWPSTWKEPIYRRTDHSMREHSSSQQGSHVAGFYGLRNWVFSTFSDLGWTGNQVQTYSEPNYIISRPIPSDPIPSVNLHFPMIPPSQLYLLLSLCNLLSTVDAAHTASCAALQCCQPTKVTLLKKTNSHWDQRRRPFQGFRTTGSHAGRQ